MSRNFNRKNSRNRKNQFSAFQEEVDVSSEKIKARQLRKTPWWRKKIAAGICHYCGNKFLPDELTMDHKVPLGRGGRSEKINLVPACKECNNKKKYLLPFEWEEYMNNLKKPPRGSM